MSASSAVEGTDENGGGQDSMREFEDQMEEEAEEMESVTGSSHSEEDYDVDVGDGSSATNMVASSMRTPSPRGRYRALARKRHRHGSVSSNCFEEENAPNLIYDPIELSSNTRLKIRINKVHVTAEWKWSEGGDDSCGICRMPFEACCVDCKFPGDECPLVLGQCRHPFHMHCILKWTETQNTAKPQCPLCRQEWKFAS